MQTSIRRFPIAAAAAVVAALASAPTFAGAQATPAAAAPASAKKPLSIDDYTKWRAIGNQSISGDGKWVAYVLTYTNVPQADTKPVLHLVKLENDQDVAIANATAPAFSADSKWIAYQVDPAANGRGGGRGRGGQNAAPPVPRHVELRNLATGAVQSWQDIQSFTFSPASNDLVIRRRPPGPAGGAAGGRGAAALPFSW